MEQKTTSPSSGTALPKGTITLASLGLTVRCVNSLKRHGISTIDQLVTWSGADLRFQIRGLGPGSIEQIEEALSEHGLSLAASTLRTAYGNRTTPHRAQ